MRLLSEEHSGKREIRETAKCYKHNPQLGSYFRWQILQAAIVKGIRLYAGSGLLGTNSDRDARAPHNRRDSVHLLVA